MEMSPGEIFDRWTILRMKAEVSEGMVEEMKRYEAAAVRTMWSRPADAPNDEAHVPKVFNLVLILMESNAKIWMLEASLRKEFKEDAAAQEELALDEIGRRAMMIRDINTRRVGAKNEIDVMYGVVPDEKVDHASQ